MSAIELYSTPLYSDTNLQAYWRLESNSNDAKNSNNGTDSNMSYATGKFNNGAVFNGSSSKITLADSSSLAFTTNGAISMWIKPDNVSSNARGEVIGQWVSGNYSWLIFQKANSGNIRFGGCSDATNTDGVEIESTTALSAGSWQHLVITKSGATVTFYIDGSSAGSGSMNASALYNSTADWIMGQNGNGDGWFDGMLDDVAFFNRALTPTEISNLYNGTFATYYTMDVTVGAFTLTGIASLFNRVSTMATSVGSFVLTGINTTFSRSYAYVINAVVGAFTIAWKNLSFVNSAYSFDSKPTSSWTNSNKPTSVYTDDSKPTTTWVNDSL